MLEKKEKWNKKNARDYQNINPVGPSYPSEFMVKLFASPYYSKSFKPLAEGNKVLDLGCAYGNNLRFFLDRKCKGYAVDINEDMVSLARNNFSKWGYDVPAAVGSNDSIPFDNNMFDVLISINTLHYQEGPEGLRRALKEFHRVLKPGGRAMIVTAGPSHEMRLNVENLGPFLYKVKNFGFRSNDLFAFFKDEKELSDLFSEYFPSVETGRMTEKYPNCTLDFLFALACKSA